MGMALPIILARSAWRFGGRGGQRWRSAVLRQLPEAVEAAAVELAQGAALRSTLQRMAARAPAPLGMALQPLAAIEQDGLSLDRALVELQAHGRLAELALFAHSVALCSVAANSPHALMLRLARRLRLRQATERAAAILLRRARRQTWLPGLPLLALPFLPLCLRPGAARALLASGPGKAIAAVALLGTCCGLLVLVRSARRDPV
jgi:Flp pilus assembly protein TadB